MGRFYRYDYETPHGNTGSVVASSEYSARRKAWVQQSGPRDQAFNAYTASDIKVHRGPEVDITGNYDL